VSVETDSRLVSGARELVAHEVLVVDGDDKVHAGLLQLLAPVGLHITSVKDPAKAEELVTTKFFGVVVVDLDTPAPNAGVSLVKAIHQRSPTSRVVVLSPRKSFDAAVTAFRAGAYDIVVKAPDQVEYLKDRILEAAGEVAQKGRAGTLLVEIRDALEDFLKRFMEAERRATDLEDKLAGRDQGRADFDEEVRILIADPDDRLYKTLLQPAPLPGFTFAFAQSGGEALDRVTNSRFHIALCAGAFPDMPGGMLVKALKTQSPEMIVIAYALGGRLEIVETTRSIPIADPFTAPAQLTDRLGELAEAHRAKGRERRYLQAFRERHYELLRRFAELRRKIDRGG
jgi:DNA-binding NtrC family response regulator